MVKQFVFTDDNKVKTEIQARHLDDAVRKLVEIYDVNCYTTEGPCVIGEFSVYDTELEYCEKINVFTKRTAYFELVEE